MPSPLDRQASELRMATFRLARRLRAEKADDELSDGQFSVLAYLHTDGSHTLRELADREHVSAPSMNRTVNCLEESGYLARSSDEADRRKVNIALTPEGTATVQETVKRRDAWLNRSLASVTDDERATLAAAAELMRRLASS